MLGGVAVREGVPLAGALVLERRPLVVGRRAHRRAAGGTADVPCSGEGDRHGIAEDALGRGEAQAVVQRVGTTHIASASRLRTQPPPAQNPARRSVRDHPAPHRPIHRRELARRERHRAARSPGPAPTSPAAANARARPRRMMLSCAGRGGLAADPTASAAGGFLAARRRAGEAGEPFVGLWPRDHLGRQFLLERIVRLPIAGGSPLADRRRSLASLRRRLCGRWARRSRRPSRRGRRGFIGRHRHGRGSRLQHHHPTLDPRPQRRARHQVQLPADFHRQAQPGRRSAE